MKLVWTKNNSPLSLLIRWGLSEPVSHFSIVFDNRVVFSSNLFGVHLEWFDSFKRHQTIVYSIDIDTILQVEEKVYLDIIGQHDGRPYDYKALLKFMWHAFKFKYFGISRPLYDISQDNRAFLCTELAFAIEPILNHSFKDGELAVMSPYQLYLICKGGLNV